MSARVAALTPTVSRLHVTYAFPFTYPSPWAAQVQIIRTCRALCELGAATSVVMADLAAPEDECLAAHGVSPHPLLELVPVSWSSRGRARRAELFEAVCGRPEPHVVVSRGAPGVRLHADLRRLGATAPRFVYEAHRPCTVRKPADSRVARWRDAGRATRLRRLEGDAVRCADGVVCLTHGVRDSLDALYGLRSPEIVLPSGTAVPATTPVGDDGRAIDIVYAGKLAKRKGVEVLIDALRLLPGRTARIAGGAPAQVDELRRRVAALGLENRVVVEGLVPHAEIAGLLRRARVAVCPLPAHDVIAEQFTSPLKVLEAMANGAPVVASDLPTVREIVEHGRTGLLVPPDDASALARGIDELLRDRSAATELAHAAFVEVSSYSWENRAARLLAFLEGVVARPPIR